MYDYGGDLIYQGVPVFIDGRADLYGAHNYKEYLDLSLYKNNYKKVIDKYNFDYYLVDKSYPINIYLGEHSDEYELIYKNKKVLMYKKRTID